MINYLTPEQVMFIHARLIIEAGGEHGIHDLGLLQSAVGRPQVTFEGQELFPDLFTKAAALLESLIGNHAFVDGNKRTAITSAGMFLGLNGYRLTADNQELEAFTLNCAEKSITLRQMPSWFIDHSVSLP